MAGELEIIANLGARHGASVLEMLRAAETVKERKPLYKVHPRCEGDAPVLSADLVHTRENLGVEPKRSDSEPPIADLGRLLAQW